MNTHPADNRLDIEETVTAAFLKDFIKAQHRSYVQLQLLAVFLLACLAFGAVNSATTAFALGHAVVGWFCIAMIAMMTVVIILSLVILRKRGALVRDVVAAPVSEEEGA